MIDAASCELLGIHSFGGRNGGKQASGTWHCPRTPGDWLLSRDGQITSQREVHQNSFRVDIPKDGVSALNIPKPGVNYVNTATEDCAPLSGGPIKDLIDRALANRN
jgi:hypothetical protein